MYAEELLLALPATHPPVDVKKPEQLQVDTLAAFTRGCTYRSIAEDWMRNANGQPPQVLELASYPAILACVAAGRCAGVVPKSLLDQLRNLPALQWVPLDHCNTALVSRKGYDTPAFTALQAALRGEPSSTVRTGT